jgi:hypothetical protein
MDYLENETTAKIDRELNSKISGLATKEDVYEVKNFVAEKFANNIKWMFIFWVGTIGAVLAVIKFA